MDVELIRSADNLAVREVLGVMRPSKMLARVETLVGYIQDLGNLHVEAALHPFEKVIRHICSLLLWRFEKWL